jgi:hypothetical protein
MFAVKLFAKTLGRSDSEKSCSAVPSDMRKAFGLPAILGMKIGLRPFWGEAPEPKANSTEAQSASAHQSAEPNCQPDYLDKLSRSLYICGCGTTCG